MNSTVAPDSPSAATPLAAALAPLPPLDQLEREWRALEPSCDSSFFTAWSWIGPWLRNLPGDCELYLYRAQTPDGATAALGILSVGSETHRRVFRRRTARLNEVRGRGCDMNIEYNGLLARRGCEREAWHRFADALLRAPLDWDELVLSAVPEVACAQLENLPGLSSMIDQQQIPWARALQADTTDLDKLLSGLSRSRRWQVRRSIKEFEKEGPVAIVAAESTQQAQAFFIEMGELHTRRWNEVGKSGSYANPRWVSFHQAVIADNFPRGEVQLLRVTCGERAIGYVYSFLWRGRVYMLQTGFSLESDNNKRPGYVSHCLAIVLNSKLGLELYDFMCGEAEYKRTLGAETPPLVWLRLQKPLLKFRLEALADRAYRSGHACWETLRARLKKKTDDTPAAENKPAETDSDPATKD